MTPHPQDFPAHSTFLRKSSSCQHTYQEHRNSQKYFLHISVQYFRFTDLKCRLSSIPPLFPVWYGLMSICRAAGFVILVSSWAKFGSGSKPFLLLRIWRQNKKHKKQVSATTRDNTCACVYLCMCGVQYLF